MVQVTRAGQAAIWLHLMASLCYGDNISLCKPERIAEMIKF